MNWAYLVLGLVGYQIVKMMVKVINHEIIQYRHKRFLRMVNIEFPDHTDITFIAVDTSDKRSMDRLKRQLREQYELSEETVNSVDK